MTRRDVSFTLALCASLVAHALLLGAGAEVYTHGVGSHIRLPGWPRQVLESALLIDPSDAQQEDPWQRLGDSSGTGKAIGTSPGEEPMLAPKGGQEQPFLSLDPAGAGNVGDDPSNSVLPMTAPAAERTPAAPQIARPAVEASAPPLGRPTPFGIGAQTEALPEPFKAHPVAPPQLAQAQSEQVASAASPNTVPLSAQRGGAAPAADPAPQAETESDPVSTIGSADFRRGSTDVRLGRKYKLIRPRLSLSAETALLTLRAPVVVLKINTDESGNVTSASVYRSSGSDDVDQPCVIAAYKWWFEPPKDKSGKPAKDVILFAVRFI